jgi:hypothetical protein
MPTPGDRCQYPSRGSHFASAWPVTPRSLLRRDDTDRWTSSRTWLVPDEVLRQTQDDTWRWMTLRTGLVSKLGPSPALQTTHKSEHPASDGHEAAMAATSHENPACPTGFTVRIT